MSKLKLWSDYELMMIRVLRDSRALPIRRIVIRRKDIYRVTSIRPTDKWLSFEGLIIVLFGGL